jgi:WD40 repeat protein
MTANKHLKQLVRARMARTGESYTAARRHVVAPASTRELAPAYVIDAHGRHGQAVTFTPDGQLLVSAGQDATIRAWNSHDGAPVFALTGHDNVVNDVVVHDQLVVSASTDRTVRLWDLRSRTPRAVLEGHRDAVTVLAAATDQPVVVSGGYDSRVRWWDAANAQLLHEIRSPLRRIAAMALMPSTGHLLVAGTGAQIVVHDGKTGDEVQRLDTGSAAVSGLAVAPDGDVVAAAGAEGTVTVWAAPEWQLVRRIDVGSRATAVDISPDGGLLAIAWDYHVGVWTLDADTPMTTAELPIKGVYAIAFAPDGTRVAQTGADGRVRCWQLR